MSEFLCEEMIFEILQRLPPKTIIRFTSVSKSWYNCIASPDFVHRYTLRSLKNMQKVLLRQQVPNANEGIFFTKVIESQLPLRPIHRLFKGQTKLEFPIRDFKIVGSCKGVLCLVDSKFKIILWNPTIRCKVVVPDHPFYRDYSEAFHIASGFGFDPITNDYKIATISFFRDREIVGIPIVYSLKNGEWCGVAATPPPFNELESRACFVNGALHWVARSYVNESDETGHDFIITFNLRTHIFGKIDPPEPNSEIRQVTNIQGYLVANTTTRVWMRKRCNNVASWFRIFNLVLQLFPKVVLFGDFCYKSGMETFVESLELLDRERESSENQPSRVVPYKRNGKRKLDA